MANNKNGISLIAVYKAFGTTEACLAYLEAARWPEGVRCVVCGGKEVSKFVTNETTREITDENGSVIKTARVPARHLYQCNQETCRFQFSATAGTIFDKSHLPLPVWVQAVALIVNAKKSVSAKQMQRDLGVNYRTAWHLNHRIREAMQSEGGLFNGTVEMDATYVGGKWDKRRKRAHYDKTQAVSGVLQRRNETLPSQVKAFPIPTEIKPVVLGIIREHVSVEAMIMTDEALRAVDERRLEASVGSAQHQGIRSRQRPYQRDRELLEPVQTRRDRQLSSGFREAPAPLP